VPPNTSADVTLSGTTPEHVRERARSLNGAPGVREVRQSGRDVIVTVGSGDYSFTVDQ